jgi:hypothetical protein
MVIPTAMASTTWYVNGTTGSDNNDCKSPTTACKTIGHAISLAASGDTIGVGPATYTENLTIRFSLNVIGSGATTTIIDGGRTSTVVLIPMGNTQVTLSKLTIQHGNAFQQRGGGIYNSGSLTISNSSISGNGAFISGGGIYNSGSLTISNSSISGNGCAGIVYGCSGGGIYSSGEVTINNSTINGNTAVTIAQGFGAAGGGIQISGGSTTLNNSTVSGNSASSRYSSSSGGGISGSATLQNSIVADNTADSGGNCAGTMTSTGYNLSSDSSCNFTGPGDLNNTDPKLGPLQNNGGPTQTQALLPGSPAIDAGNPSGCTDSLGRLLKTDQRGAPRPDKEDSGGCDMGAYERQTD